MRVERFVWYIHGKTKSHKPELEIGLGKATRKNKLPKDIKKVEKLDIRVDSCMNVRSTSISLLEVLGIEIQHERKVSPFKLSS